MIFFRRKFLSSMKLLLKFAPSLRATNHYSVVNFLPMLELNSSLLVLVLLVFTKYLNLVKMKKVLKFAQVLSVVQLRLASKNSLMVA